MDTKQTEIEDGGPVYPRPASKRFLRTGVLDIDDTAPAQEGISLRDHFAMEILKAVLTKPETNDIPAHALTLHVYEWADAMIQARKRGG